jgi:AraC-like DNA-binding protein
VDALDRLNTGLALTNIDRAPQPSALALHTKAVIDREYEGALEIGRISARYRTSSAVLSRTFRRTFGIPPVRYRHHVRVMDALMQFAEGAAPIDVFQNVGFDDLSRFYKIFRKITCSPPGTYRQTRSRIAKT